ncbi:MAG: hypothetical protein ABW128_07450 [Rhizorhabdus sp.]
MTAFVWPDRDGQRHELDSPAMIEAEVAEVAREMDGYVALLDNPDRMLRDPARTAIGWLRPRLVQLRADLVRWNEHAVAIIRGEAMNLAGRIERLPAKIADVLLVVELHAEQARLRAIAADSPDMQARMLAEPMTATQRRAISACASLTLPADTATRGEAKAWLDAEPRFARSGQVDGGWFAWADRNGHAHRLTDPLAIEREVVAIAKELAVQRPGLTATGDLDALYKAVDAAGASWERLRILQGELERYEREAAAREDTAWTAYAADWRSKRKTS